MADAPVFGTAKERSHTEEEKLCLIVVKLQLNQEKSQLVNYKYGIILWVSYRVFHI